MLLEKKMKVNDYKKNKEILKPKLSIILNFIIYGGFIAIGVFLLYLYSAYIFINK